VEERERERERAREVRTKRRNDIPRYLGTNETVQRAIVGDHQRQMPSAVTTVEDAAHACHRKELLVSA
jgi:hypothetical protein